MMREIYCEGNACIHNKGQISEGCDTTVTTITCSFYKNDTVIWKYKPYGKFCEGYQSNGEDKLSSVFICEQCGTKERFSNNEILQFEKNRKKAFWCKKCSKGYYGFQYFMNKSPLLWKYKMINYLTATIFIFGLILALILLKLYKN
jgi:hypothetical protein